MDIVQLTYAFTDTLPDVERYGLQSQINRSAVSIPSNIAEGSGRSTGKNFAQFINIAAGSAYELETQLLICQRLGKGKVDLLHPLLELLNEEQRMLRSFKLQL